MTRSRLERLIIPSSPPSICHIHSSHQARSELNMISLSPDLVLVTGANGHVAQHIVDQALDDPNGPRVRGTVRSAATRDSILQHYRQQELKPTLIQPLKPRKMRRRLLRELWIGYQKENIWLSHRSNKDSSSEVPMDADSSARILPSQAQTVAYNIDCTLNLPPWAVRTGNCLSQITIRVCFHQPLPSLLYRTDVCF